MPNAISIGKGANSVALWAIIAVYVLCGVFIVWHFTGRPTGGAKLLGAIGGGIAWSIF